MPESGSHRYGLISEQGSSYSITPFQLDPYRFDRRPTGRGFGPPLEDKQGLQQMESEPTDNPDSTSLETYVDASPEFRLERIATVVCPGHVVVEVKDTDPDGGRRPARLNRTHVRRCGYAGDSRNPVSRRVDRLRYYARSVGPEPSISCRGRRRCR